MPRDTIIYAWNYLSWGGAQVYFLGLIKKARETFDIKVVLPEASDPQIISYFEKEGAEVITFSPHFESGSAKGFGSKIANHRTKSRSEKAMLEAVEAIAVEGRTIVHAELAPWQCYSSLVWLLLRYPVFITMHNAAVTGNPLRNLFWLFKMRVVSRFSNFHPFTSNEDTKNQFRGYFSDELSDRTVVTYTTANLEKIDAALSRELDSRELRRKHGLPEDKRLVIAVGQFIDRKGRWEFLDSASNVANERENVHFVWISNVPFSEEERERVEEHQNGGYFTFLSSSDVAAEHIDLFVFMRMAEVFVLPSHTEGLPISILEAMALSLPVISTRINAIPEAIKSGENGLLVAPRNSKELTASILRLLDDEELRLNLADKGNATVRSKFDEKRVAAIAYDEYLKVIGE